MERGAEPEPPPRNAKGQREAPELIRPVPRLKFSLTQPEAASSDVLASNQSSSARCRASAAALRALLSWAAFAGSRAKISGSASAASILAMMPLMRSISASASRYFLPQRRVSPWPLLRAELRQPGLSRCDRAAASRMPRADSTSRLIVVEIAVVGRDRAVCHHPQLVGAGVDQVAVVAHHDHGAGKLVDRLGQRCAAVDVEMVGRLVENDQLRTEEGRKPEQQPRLLAARQILHRRVGGGRRKADRAGACAHLRLRRIGQQLADVRVGRAVLVQFVELMLGEISDREACRRA